MSIRDQSIKIKVMREYLYQNKVNLELSGSTEAQVLKAMSTERRRAESEVKALTLLPLQMRSKIAKAVYGQRLRSFPCIIAADTIDDHFLASLCTYAVSTKMHEPGEHLFVPSQLAEGARVPHWGQLQYTQDKNNFPVGEGQWISEAALWIAEWTHVGWLVATTPCEVLTLKTRAFLSVVKSIYPHARNLLHDFSAAFAEEVDAEIQKQNKLSDLLDVDQALLVSAMPKSSRAYLSVPALHVLERQVGWRSFSWTGQAKLDKLGTLKNEVFKGTCDLIMEHDHLTGSEQVHRLVSVVVLRVVLEDTDRVLVHLGRVEDGAPTPSETADNLLPGNKIQADEMPRDACLRLLRSKLFPLEERIQLRGYVAAPPEERTSSRYGVATKYIRMIFEATCAECSQVSDESRLVDPGGELDMVFTVPSGYENNQEVAIYGWLTTEDVERLGGDDCKGLLAKWVSRLTRVPSRPGTPSGGLVGPVCRLAHPVDPTVIV